MKEVFNYSCEGQMSIYDYLEQEKLHDLDIRGLCDDPYCPSCGYGFRTYGSDNEIDIERCPKCNIRVSWDRWHRMNDEEMMNN